MQSRLERPDLWKRSTRSSVGVSMLFRNPEKTKAVAEPLNALKRKSGAQNVKMLLEI